MTHSSDFMTGRCMMWKTKKPEEDIPRLSPVFRFQDIEWRLEFSLDEDLDYILHLNKMCESDNFQPFDVNVYGECKGKDATPIAYSNNRITSLNLTSFIWFASEENIQNNIKDYNLFGYITLVLIFCGDEGSTLFQPETGNQFTQTYLDSDLESLSSDFGYLLDSGALPDIHLKCGGTTFPTHRSILSARSEIFSAMFIHKMKESISGIVNITDVDSHVLNLFLKFMYSGRLVDVPNDILPKLYTFGDKYAVKSLMKVCRNLMVENISEENYPSLLIMANDHNDEDFKNAVMRFIGRRLYLLKGETWYKFTGTHPEVTNEVYRKLFEKIDLRSTSCDK